MNKNTGLPGSFRDPSGFLFRRDGILYRQLNAVSKEDYDRLTDSGLYKNLSDAALLITHEEVGLPGEDPDRLYKVIKPAPIPFISYPYEWSFSQLKDAALATLEIQLRALDYGMSLKDCSAYNIQFMKNRPILIDTLSFENYLEGKPWAAYRQFCQHFLGPLALMSYKDVRLNQLFRIYLDAPALDLVSLLLPFRTRLIPDLFLHIHLHAQSQRYYADKRVQLKSCKLNRQCLIGIVKGLRGAVRKMRYKPNNSQWQDYYQNTNYSHEALAQKKQIIADFLDRITPAVVWDLGANTGFFSRIASERGIFTVAFDIDHAAVEKNYIDCIKNNDENILPLLADLTNPSPGIGWENQERMSFFDRGPADAVFALALVHHLAISNNLPFCRIAEFFQRIAKWLVIEFIPKEDSQVKRLLYSREDIFTDYTQENFENEFRRHFSILGCFKIKGSSRSLYLMKKI